MMELENELLKISLELYGELSNNRSDVDRFFSILSRFNKYSYNEYLKKRFTETLTGAVPINVLNELKKILDEAVLPFDKFSSENKRLRYLKNKKLYEEPIMREIKTVPKVKEVDNKKLLIKVPISTLHIRMQNSLKRILEIEGLFDALKKYMNYLENESTTLENFIQGKVWKKMIKEDDKTDGTVLPLVVAYDDVETGNGLGPRGGVNEFGAVYATVPCFPPDFSSKLKSVIVTDVFQTSLRKDKGNKKIFDYLISELKSLRTDGFFINVNGVNYKIYVYVAQFLADNLGLNSIFGVVSSFSKSYCCRDCYASPEQICSLIREDVSLLRTKEQYDRDEQELNPSETGIKELCVFSSIEGIDFKSGCYDILHDFDEGCGNRDMCNIILKLINGYEYFSIQFLNDQIQNTKFNFEVKNHPILIDIHYLEKNKRLKMTAAESLFLIRYFGLFVGKLVPRDHEVWKFYIKVRRIADILHRPKMNEGLIKD